MGAALRTWPAKRQDDLPLLEYMAPRDLLASGEDSRFTHMVQGDNWPYGRLDTLIAGLGSDDDRGTSYLKLARVLMGFGRRNAARRWLERAGARSEFRRQAARNELLPGQNPVRDRTVPGRAGRA